MAARHGQLEVRLADYPMLDHGDIVPFSQTTLLVSMWTGTALAAVFTVLRSWLQYRHNSRWFANDYLLGVALLLHIALSITITCMVTGLYEGLNGITMVGALNLSALDFLQPSLLKYQFAALIQLWTVLWTVKMAILSFYWRLYNAVRTKARIFWWIIFGVTIAAWTVSIFLQAFACDPPTQTFSPAAFVKPQSIAGFNRAFRFAAILDILTDIMIMLVPLPLLRTLQLPHSQTVVLLFIFLTPLFAIIFAILNLIFESIKTLGPTINPLRLMLYSTLEISLFIVTACLPSLRLYFKDRRTTSSNGKQIALRPQGKVTPHRSIDWGAMVLQPITRATSRPISESFSMDHILSPRSPDFHNYGREEESHENIGQAV